MLYRALTKLVLPLFDRAIVSVEGIDNLPVTGPFIIAANHVDYLDGFYLTRTVMRNRPHMVKFLSVTKRYWWTGGATIPIDPNDKRGSLTTAQKALAGDVAVCIFIEGQRNPGQRMLHGKTGAVRLALSAQLPIIPVGITDVSGKNFAASMRLLSNGKQQVTIRFGKALRYTGSVDRTREELDALTTEVIRSIAPLCAKTY